MYISTESYEEMYLKDKNEEAVMAEVEKLRREILRVKNKIESPAYASDVRAFPREDAVIEIYRGYLERATKTLAEMRGVSSVLTEEEKSAAIVDSMLEDISCITLTIGRYYQDKYELIFGEDEVMLVESHLEKESVSCPIDRFGAFEVIGALHIGEWKETYTPEQYGCTLNEPTGWELRIDYRTGAAPRFYSGLGVFPYNFDLLCRLMGAEIY